MEELLKQTVTFYDLILIFICYIIARLTYAFISGFIKGVSNSIKKIKNQNN
jgi:hypothetical protein